MQDCSPASGEGKIAEGYFTDYWEKNNATCASGGHCRTAFMANMSGWDWSVNDADFCDEGGYAEVHKQSNHCAVVCVCAWLHFGSRYAAPFLAGVD